MLSHSFCRPYRMGGGIEHQERMFARPDRPSVRGENRSIRPLAGSATPDLTADVCLRVPRGPCNIRPAEEHPEQKRPLIEDHRGPADPEVQARKVNPMPQIPACRQEQR